MTGGEVFKVLVSIIACALACSIARAAEVTPTTVPGVMAPKSQIAASCELHVWPAPRLEFVTNIVNSLFHSSAKLIPLGYDVAEQLLPSVQDRIFAGMDLGQVLDMPGATIVYHEAPLDVRDRRDNGRRLTSRSPCYAELIVSSLFYAEAGLGSRQLQAIFLFRRFDAGPAPVREFSQSGLTELHVFPPQDQQSVTPGMAELIDAFRSNVMTFAGKLRAPPARGLR
jgi:hypothetical protein